MISGRFLSVLSPRDPAGGDLAYVAELQELFEHHSAGGTVPLTEKDDY